MENGWIHIDEYCARHNEKRATVSQRVTDGVWERGEYYAIPDGKEAFVHEARALEWLEARRRAATGT